VSFNRFERKLLAAIVVATTMPLLGALVLGQAALREAYRVGVNPRVREELDRGLGLYRTYFTTLRKHADESASAIAADWALRTAVVSGDREALDARLRVLLERNQDIAKIQVTNEDGQPLGAASIEARSKNDARLLQVERPLADVSQARLNITLAAPSRPFLDYQRAGELVEVYRRLERGGGQVAGFFIVVYTGFLLSVIVAALAVGIVMARRVTRRVSVLAEATRRVGSGDLQVQVPTDTADEIGELTNDFNTMVRDLRESRDRIEYLQRIGGWQEFARRLAHEIKNPLTPIQLAIQEVHKSYPGGDPRFDQRLNDARTIIEEEVATLRRLTAEFSTFAKLPEATLARADLNDFVRDLARSFETIADVRGAAPAATEPNPIEVKVELATQALPVRIDNMMLKLCLENLVRNAVEALRLLDGPQRVLVRLHSKRDRAVLEVHDSGPGVSAVDRQRIFDPYFTTKADGTGLGLPIVKKVVLEHHGSIVCEESELGGAMFRIELPLAAGS
jgi:two-component system, NtrC family, nitrogen regulation sensor histidine kinase NtrY